MSRCYLGCRGTLLYDHGALKHTMNFEKQKACEEEREFARNRYQKQFERDEIEVILVITSIVSASKEKKYGRV